MNTISVVFLLVLAVEASSAATTLPPYPQCTAKLELGECVVVVEKDYCLLDQTAWPGLPTTAPPCLCECVFPPENPVEVCCETKTVGAYSYTKVSTGTVPSNCLNDCIYTRDDKLGSKYCFASGVEEVHCLDDGGPDYAEHIQILNGLTLNGKTYNSSNLFCGSGGRFFSDIRTFDNNAKILKGFNFHVPTVGPPQIGEITSIQGIYGELVVGTVHGIYQGTPNVGFLINAGNQIGKITGQCVEYHGAPTVRLIVGNMQFYYKDGSLAGSFGVPESSPASSFSTNVPEACKLDFISGRSGARLDAIKFWWGC